MAARGQEVDQHHHHGRSRRKAEREELEHWQRQHEGGGEKGTAEGKGNLECF